MRQTRADEPHAERPGGQPWARAVRIVLACMAIAGTVLWAERPDRLPLDGDWEFRFAPDDRGNSEQWYDAKAVFAGWLRVPGCWDAQGVGAANDKLRSNAIGVGWYRRAVDLRPEWQGRRVWLVVGGAHRSVQAWVNGTLCGEHIGYPTEFRQDITAALTPKGAQRIVLAVDSRRDASRDPLAGAFDLLDFMDQHWGGLFEHVWLEATGDAWLADAFAVPDPQRGAADLQAEIGRAQGTTPGPLRLAWTVRTDRRPDRDAVLAEGGTDIGTDRASTRVTLALPEAPRWTPETPTLLTADLVLSAGTATVDRCTVRFGLRRVDAAGSDFRLNGERFFLRGYGDDYTFPIDLAAPADVDSWKRHMVLRKSFGFNGVRHHSTMPSESYLRAADEVGLFVQPELPIAYEPFFKAASADARALYAQVWRDYIRQMRNHPSVFAWCMGNEQWQGLDLGPELYALAKALDPTRPVIDSDGVWPGNQRPTLDYLSVQFSEGTIPWGKARGKYRIEDGPKPVIVHEMGNLSTLPDPAEIAGYRGVVRPFWLEAMAYQVHRRGLDAVLPAMLRASAGLQAALIKLNTEAARLSPGVDGHHQWLFRDYWTQSTGFVSQFDRARRLTPEAAREFIAESVLLWDRERVTYRSGETVALRFFVSDFRPKAARPLGALEVRVGDTAVALTPPADPGGRGLLGPWVGTLTCPALAKPTRLDVRAVAGEARNAWSLWVFPTPPPPPEALIRRHLTPALLARLAAGAAVLLTDETAAFPTLTARFKPAWWKGDDARDHGYGNLFLRHAALGDFPVDDYGDLQTYRLLEARPVVLLDEVPGRLDPIVWCLDVPWRLRRKAYLFEARVGRGRMLVSTFDLSARACAEDPAAAWMLASLAGYTGSQAFAPAGEIPLPWLEERVAARQLPDPATWIEGYGKVVETTDGESRWHSHREDDVPVYAVRQTDGKQRLAWQTAAVPADWPHPTASFVWAGGIGWRSQPAGGGFAVSLDGQPVLDIPFVTTTTRWHDPGGSITLDYRVRRTTEEDSFGVFILTVPTDRVRRGSPVELAVTASAQNSRRWLSLVPYTDVAATERAAETE